MNETFRFLEELGRNNNRPWFAAHKDIYDSLRQAWLDQLQNMINHMALWEPALGRFSAKECAYRIYRDTRFSPDKTPYKVYFSALMSPYGRKSDHAGYYLQMDSRPGESGLYGGLWCPDSAQLKKLRKAFDDNSEELLEILSEPVLQSKYPGWCGRALKTAPKGWAKDHPLIEVLRLCDIGKYMPVDRRYFDDPLWPERAADDFRPLKPLVDFINYSLDE